MSRWKQLVKPPKGALPGGIVTKAGIALIAVLVAGMLFSWSLTGPAEDPTAPAAAEPQAVDGGMGRSFLGRIRAGVAAYFLRCYRFNMLQDLSESAYHLEYADLMRTKLDCVGCPRNLRRSLELSV